MRPPSPGIARDFVCAGGGVITFMHDLNLTAGFAQHMILMAQGRAFAADAPRAVMTDVLLGRACGCDVRVGVTPSAPFLLPQPLS